GVLVHVPGDGEAHLVAVAGVVGHCDLALALGHGTSVSHVNGYDNTPRAGTREVLAALPANVPVESMQGGGEVRAPGTSEYPDQTFPIAQFVPGPPLGFHPAWLGPRCALPPRGRGVPPVLEPTCLPVPSRAPGIRTRAPVRRSGET